MLNLRSGFIRLAMYYANVDSNMTEGGRGARPDGRRSSPAAKIPMGWELESDLAGFYHRIGRMEKFEELAADVETRGAQAPRGGAGEPELATTIRTGR